MTPAELRDLVDKPVATVGDALYLVASLDSPDITKDMIDLKGDARLLALKADAPLDCGTFSTIAIEMKKAKSSIIYSLTGLGKYASESLSFQGIFPTDFSWNRQVSGYELIEFATALRGLSNK
jgi:hypothetical protein